MPLNPSQVANNWANGMAQAGEKIRQGIQAVTESPTHLAARSIDRMVAGIQRAAAEGKIQRGLEAVSLEDWKRAALEKGVGRVGAGATAAKPKMQVFFEEFLPHLERGQAALASMPRGDIEANIARANAMMRHNATFKRTRR